MVMFLWKDVNCYKVKWNHGSCLVVIFKCGLHTMWNELISDIPTCCHVHPFCVCVDLFSYQWAQSHKFKCAQHFWWISFSWWILHAVTVTWQHNYFLQNTNQKITHLAGKVFWNAHILPKCTHFNRILHKMHQNALKYLIFNEKSHLASWFWSQQSEVYHFVLGNSLVTFWSDQILFTNVNVHFIDICVWSFS